ncbi:MAG: hypothetical protein VX681_16565 [Myxococcota bacterium]|nr:hypothetical protein [Myxococcota bacterium]
MIDREDSPPGLAPDYRLSDRYTADSGTVFMTGLQALARLPIEQLRVDRSAGLHTAAFVSGYPGSPAATRGSRGSCIRRCCGHSGCAASSPSACGPHR